MNNLRKVFFNDFNNIFKKTDRLKYFLVRLKRYSAAFFLLNIIGLATIPVLIHIFGTSYWAQMIVAQFLGQIFTVIVDAGFSSYGASEISILDNSKKIQYLKQSNLTRLVFLILLFPIFILLNFFIIGDFLFSLFLISLANLLPALNPSWYYIATGDYSNYTKRIIFPKAISSLVGTLFCTLYQDAILYGIVLLLGTIYSIHPYQIVSPRLIKREFKIHYQSIKQDLASFRFLLNIFGNLLGFLPLLVFGKIHHHSLPDLALADKISKYFLGIAQPVVAAIQGATFNLNDKNNDERGILSKIQLVLIFASIPIILIIASMVPIFSKIISSWHIQLKISDAIPIAILTFIALLYWFQSTIFISNLNLRKQMFIGNAFSIFSIFLIGILSSSWSFLTCLWALTASQSIPIVGVQLAIIKKLRLF